MRVHLLLEGHLEEPVSEKLLEYCGHERGTVYGKKGCAYIHEKAKNYQALANPSQGVLVLTDSRDTGSPCPSDALQNTLQLAKPPANFLCRLAVNELESWLIADSVSLSNFLRISPTLIPKNPDVEPLPKITLVNLARRSRKTKIKNGIVPPEKHGGPVAPAYLATMTEYVREHWNIDNARKNSPSLERCVVRLFNLRNSEPL